MEKEPVEGAKPEKSVLCAWRTNTAFTKANGGWTPDFYCSFSRSFRRFGQRSVAIMECCSTAVGAQRLLKCLPRLV